MGKVRVLILRSFDTVWKKMCDNPHQMIASFRDVGISLNIDGSEDNEMKFQGQGRGLPDDIIIG